MIKGGLFCGDDLEANRSLLDDPVIHPSPKQDQGIKDKSGMRRDKTWKSQAMSERMDESVSQSTSHSLYIRNIKVERENNRQPPQPLFSIPNKDLNKKNKEESCGA